jgi:hypothetical protein
MPATRQAVAEDLRETLDFHRSRDATVSSASGRAASSGIAVVALATSTRSLDRLGFALIDVTVDS